LKQCPEAEEKHSMGEQCNAPNYLEVAVLLAQEVKVSINILYQKNQRTIYHEQNGIVSSPRNIWHVNILIQCMLDDVIIQGRGYLESEDLLLNRKLNDA
jgi:hypothetical protein